MEETSGTHFEGVEVGDGEDIEELVKGRRRRDRGRKG